EDREQRSSLPEPQPGAGLADRRKHSGRTMRYAHVLGARHSCSAPKAAHSITWAMPQCHQYRRDELFTLKGQFTWGARRMHRQWSRRRIVQPYTTSRLTKKLFEVGHNLVRNTA